MIIYLHGFNSSGESAKGLAIQNAFRNEITVYTPTYHYDPARAISDLTQYITQKIAQHPEDKKCMIIGSSLGGFYAQYLGRQFPGTRVVLINPALGPIESLENHLGENVNYYSGEKYILTVQHLEVLKQFDIAQPCLEPIPTLLLIDKGDELIPYQHALKKYQSCGKQVLFEGGNHQFQHLPEAVCEIKKFYFQG